MFVRVPIEPTKQAMPYRIGTVASQSGLGSSSSCRGRGHIVFIFCFLQVAVVAQPPSREDDDQQRHRPRPIVNGRLLAAMGARKSRSTKNASKDVCIKTTRSTLPLVLLKSHV
jgi:hypothetical protein